MATVEHRKFLDQPLTIAVHETPNITVSNRTEFFHRSLQRIQLPGIGQPYLDLGLPRLTLRLCICRWPIFFTSLYFLYGSDHHVARLLCQRLSTQPMQTYECNRQAAKKSKVTTQHIKHITSQSCLMPIT